jgi:hypothetical protein
MTSHAASSEHEIPLFSRHSVDKMPAHWLTARLGKRVLRSGGVETTQWLLEHADVQPSDDVIEFAPGLGATAREIVARSPKSYVGVERDSNAKILADRSLAISQCPNARVIQDDALHVPLEDGCATLVLGEAMLSMHLLEPARIIQDEGLFGAGKFVFNVLTTPGARRRLLHVRSVFRKYDSNLCAVALVARRTP